MTDQTDESDFSSGFAEQEPVEMLEVVQPVITQLDELAQKYAQVTEEELETLRSRAKMVDEIKATNERQFGTAFGKMGGMERTLKQLQEQMQSGGDAPDITKDDLSQTAEMYPDLAEAFAKDLKNVLGKSRGGQSVSPDKLQEMVNNGVSAVLPTVEAQITRRMEIKALTREIPDWEATLKGAEFSEWFAKQAQDYQLRSRDSEDSDVVVGVIKDFRKDREGVQRKSTDDEAKRKQAAQSRTQQLTAAVQPRGHAGSPAQQTALDDFMAGYSS